MTTIRAHFDGRVLVPDEPVNLPKNAPLEVDVRPMLESAPSLADLASLATEFPPNPDAPRDRASQHEHYLYGTPKKP
jgi:hypothetical protein